jgi:hypothetical protein
MDVCCGVESNREPAWKPFGPYRTGVNQAGMATFGGGELIDLIAHASGIALKACWDQKWAVHRRLRPESRSRNSMAPRSF